MLFSEEELSYDIIRRRELKWIDMFENWEKWMSKRFKKVMLLLILPKTILIITRCSVKHVISWLSIVQVKERCRKGIPSSLRGRAWQYLTGSKFLMEQHGNKGRFEVGSVHTNTCINYLAYVISRIILL